MTEKERDFLSINVMGCMMLILDKYDELRDSNIYRQSIKSTGNRFYQELVKVTNPIEGKILAEDKNTEGLNVFIYMLEGIIDGISTMTTEEMEEIFNKVKEIKSREK